MLRFSTIFLTLLFISNSNLCHAQAPFADFPDKIPNKRSINHRQVPFSRVYIAAPKGYDKINGFPALLKNTDSGIMVNERDSTNYYELLPVLKNQTEKLSGKVINYKNIKVGKYDGVYASFIADSTNIYSMITFGDSTCCVNVLVLCPSKDMASAKELHDALKTVYYQHANPDPNEPGYNETEQTLFSVNDDNSIFQFARIQTNGFYVYESLKHDNKKESSPFVVVFHVNSKEYDLKHVADFVFEELKRDKASDIKESDIVENTVNGYSAYHRTIQAIVKTEKVMIYQQVIKKGDDLVCINGITRVDFDLAAQEFKKLASTVKFL